MQSPTLTLEDLRLVQAIALGHGLSGAARRLGVDHSTAYRRLNALEARLGVRVAERLRAGYVLTAAGEEMLAAAEGLEDTLAELHRRIAGRDLQLEGTIRLTAPDDLVVGLLTPILARFRAGYPAIRLEVITDNRMLSLTRREADVAVRPSRHQPEDLTGRRIGTIAGAIYAAPQLAADYAAALADADDAAHGLSQAPWIAFDSAGDNAYGRFVAARVPPDAVVYRSNSLLTQAAAAVNGIGLAALPCFLGDADSGLTRVRPPLDALAGELWLLTHRDLRTTARVRALLDVLHADLRVLRPRLAGEAD